MQNNIAELTQKLLGALDSNYNVIDMATIVEVIAILEKVSITKELLETTRLGKHINELRRNTQNESLARRAKELVKKWRNNILPVVVVVPDSAATTNGQVESRKRLASAPRLDENVTTVKKTRVNGTSHLVEYFSDNSNSSFKEAIVVPTNNHNQLIAGGAHNSDSNSSLADVVSTSVAAATKNNEPIFIVDDHHQQPARKRGRKKGSKTHRNLLDEAETSFSNKMAVSRGNAKVKTTQELIASLQSRSSTTTSNNTSPSKNNIEDWNERAAKLTERVSLIDQKLNASGRHKRKQPHGASKELNKNKRAVSEEDDDEIVVVDDEDTSQTSMTVKQEENMQEAVADCNYVPSLSVEEALSRLPPIEIPSDVEEDVICRCSIELGDETDANGDFSVTKHEDTECPARTLLERRYRLDGVDQSRVHELHHQCLESVNGNFGLVPVDGAAATVKGEEEEASRVVINDARARIVPNFYELPAKRADRDTVCENYRKYCISERANTAAAADGSVSSSNLRLGLGDSHLDTAATTTVEAAASTTTESSKPLKVEALTPPLIPSTPLIAEAPPPTIETPPLKLQAPPLNLQSPPPRQQSPASTLDDAASSKVKFSEFHEVVDRPSYNDELLRILPYVIID